MLDFSAPTGTKTGPALNKSASCYIHVHLDLRVYNPSPTHEAEARGKQVKPETQMFG